MQKFKIKDRAAFEVSVRHLRLIRANAAIYMQITMELGLDKGYLGIHGTRRIRKKRLKRAFMRAALGNVFDQLEPQ